MQSEESFPTFKKWWRDITSPKKRVRHSLGKSSRKTRASTTTTQVHEGDSFALNGVIKPGMDSKYAINGADFVIDDDTWVFGEIAYGNKAIIEGVVGLNGERLAAKVTIQK